jgi:hypothetical protein
MCFSVRSWHRNLSLTGVMAARQCTAGKSFLIGFKTNWDLTGLRAFKAGRRIVPPTMRVYRATSDGAGPFVSYPHVTQTPFVGKMAVNAVVVN